MNVGELKKMLEKYSDDMEILLRPENLWVLFWFRKLA